MIRKTLERNYKKIENLVLENKLKDAFEVLKDLVIKSRKGDFFNEFERMDKTYENLLKYTIDGIDDPDRDKIFRKLQVSTLELSDLALQHALMNESDLYVYRLKKKLEFESKQMQEEVLNKFATLAFDEELSELLKSSIDTSLNEKEEYQKHQEVLIHIFNLIWLTDKFKESDVKMIQSIWKQKSFPWFEKSIVISAMTISLIRCFDTKKIDLLVDFCFEEEDQVRQRALVGLFLCMHIYNARIDFYPSVKAKIGLLSDIPGIGKEIELIAIQFLKSRETEKITKKLEEEIIPEMVKYQPILKDKLDLDNIISEDYMEDKNPDWERVFEDAPDLLDKLQEISKMQMEGADVFMSAFARLKHFDFFNELINWFRPFHKDNFVITELLQNEPFESDLFLDGLVSSFFMCNSDKYSFCLNLQHMPDMQKSMMMEMFNAELEGIKELQGEDELLNKSANVKSIYAQYIHDLYRFYKLHPQKYEFLDVFGLEFDFSKSLFFELVVRDEQIFRNIAEFLFEKDHFKSALRLFLSLNEKGDNSLEIFEKIGYCFQKLKNYPDALSFYKKAELYDANRSWNLKKLALCNRYLKNFEESLKYYLEAEKLEPDNMYIQTYIGHSYLDLGNYEKALDYYHKVEYLADENKKVLRPIAWCLFVMGKFESAKKYYENLMVNMTNKHDYMNLGHVEWCLGNRQAALKNYRLSLTHEDNSMKAFLISFNEDKKYLLKFGIDPFEITLMMDYLKYMG